MPQSSAPSLSLVADVGGTNTRVALACGAQVQPDSVRRYANDDYADLDAVLTRFLTDAGGATCDGACVAMAGPVRDGVAELTNRGWSIDRPQLAEVTGAGRVAILNDLQAQGHAIGHLPEGGIAPVIAGTDPATPGAARMVMGIGTGFNIAPIYMAEPHRLVPPSEAGHALLPLRSAKDLRLGAFLAQDHGVAAIEDLLSGRGLSAAYAFLAEEAGEDATPLPPKEVMARLDRGEPRATETAQLFTRFMGIVAGNLALVQLPFGGIYLSGGVARGFAPMLERFGFDAAFRDKGRFSDFMGQFSVSVITDDYAALTGCAAHLVNLG